MADTVRQILVIGANPAWEKVLEFKTFRAGEVNRAVRASGYAAGKATNFCRALKCLGGLPGHQITFLGGETGRLCAASLRSEGLSFEAVSCASETRVCTNCVCGGQMTELVEPGTPIDDAMLEEFLALAQKNLASVAGIAVAGSIPAGTTPRFMPEIAELARKNNLPLLLDNYQNAGEALEIKPQALLKINRLELQKMMGGNDIAEGLTRLREKYPQLTAAITDGPGRAWLLEAGTGCVRAFDVPKLRNVVNPLGAGDTASAVFFARWLEGFPVHTAFTEALACASASCLTNQAGFFCLE